MAKQLGDVTECPICTEVCTDPRVLPCEHTYCLKCIEAWSKDKQLGDKLACPLCRKKFTLSSNGVRGLPKNISVANHLQMKELSSVESTTSPCEACSGGGEGKSWSQNMASVYCVECQMKLCRHCERAHKGVKFTRFHKLVEIGESADIETLHQSFPPSYCDQHQDKRIEIYCNECKMAMCMMCYMELHNTHKWCDVSNVESDLRIQMASDVDNVGVGVEKCREMLESLAKVRNHWDKRVAKTGTEINEKAKQLKQMIDNHKEKLMNELSTSKQKRMKAIESLREEIERQLLAMESYKKYVDELRQKGTACDVAIAASGLHDRADELLMFDVIERTLADVGHGDVRFTSSNFVVDDSSKTLGPLSLTAVNTVALKPVPTLTHAIIVPSQGKGDVSAVATLGDDVFVVPVVGYGSRQVDVYNAERFTLQRHIAVPELGSWASGLVVCGRNKCLYLSSYWGHSIHRVELSPTNAAKKWSVASYPAGLSVNNAQNLVVACDGANKLQEYSTDGSLVREISLQADVSSPWHAIQLSAGNYVITQRTSPGVVSVVGLDGQVLHSYGQSEKSDVGKMEYPASLAVTKNDKILVADEGNNRILSINTSMGYLRELPLSAEGGGLIHSPRCLCLDESRGRLYVCEWVGQQRVLVFDDVRL